MQHQSSEFYRASTADLLKIVNKDCAYVLTSSFQEFYSITLEYIGKWYRLERHPKYINWTRLKVQAIEYEEVRELAKQVDPRMATKDELFDEVHLSTFFSRRFQVMTFVRMTPKPIG